MGRASSTALAIGLASIVGCGGHASNQNADAGSMGGNGGSLGSGGNGGSLGTGGAGGAQLPGGLTVLAGLPGGVGQRDEVGRAARLAEPAGLADDGHGHLYIADTGAATIRKLDLATGALTTLAGTPSYTNRPPAVDGTGAAALLSNPTDIAFDGSDLYVADGSQVRRIDPNSGAVTTIAGAGTASASVITYPRKIAADNQGNLFVDSNSRVLLKIAIATGQVTPLVGDPNSNDFIDGVGSAGHLVEPRALALDGAGALYVLDGGAVRRIDLATNTLTSLPIDLPGFGPHHVAGMASDTAGHLYLSDLFFDTVYRFTPASGALVGLAGADNVPGSEDGPPPQGHLNSPTSLIVGSSGAIYLSDRDNATIRQIDVTTGAMTTLAGEAPHIGANDGVHDVARFKTPLGLSTDASGNLFVADAGNHSIRRVNVATGAVTAIAGDPNNGASVDGVGAMGKFISPIGVAAGPSGTVYVVDDIAFNVRQVDVATAMVTTIAGKAGEIGGGDGPGSIARFWTPAGITYDSAGTGAVLVTDANAAIRVIDRATDNVSTAVILPMLPGGGYALFNPVGVASDGNGNAYVADASQHTISRVVLATGAVSLIAGSRNQPGAADGVGDAARFNAPTGLAYDGRGHLFVTEPDNHVVRRVTIATGEVTTVVGVASERGVKTGPLPGRLNSPYGIAALATGELLISDRAENVVLLAK